MQTLRIVHCDLDGSYRFAVVVISEVPVIELM